VNVYDCVCVSESKCEHTVTVVFMSLPSPVAVFEGAGRADRWRGGHSGDAV